MKMMRRTLAALAAGAVLASAGSALAQNKVLRFVQNGNLTILDPIWTTAYVTRNHGYLIYDTLFCVRREQRRQAADGRQVRGLARQDRVDLHAARWPRMARRQAGHLRGLHRLHPALGQARRHGPQAHGLRQGVQGGRRQDLPDDAEGAVRPGARLARQAHLQRAVHDAQGGRRDRRLQADRQPDRLGPVHLPEGRVQARREARLSEEPQVQAALRAGLGPGRRQGRQGRPRRDHRDARRPAAGERDHQRRDRPDRAAAARPAPAAEEGKGRARWSTGTRSGTSFVIRFNSRREAVRQSQDPHGCAAGDAPGGLPQGHDRRARHTTRSARRRSSAAHPTPSTRPTACWSSRTSRSPRRF